jgi:hypothetical protein
MEGDASGARDYVGRVKIQDGFVQLPRTSARQPRAPWREGA